MCHVLNIIEQFLMISTIGKSASFQINCAMNPRLKYQDELCVF